MFGKQTKKKEIEKEIPVVEESVDLEIEDIKEEVIEEPTAVNDTPKSTQDKIKKLEQQLQKAKEKDLEEKKPENFMTVKGVELIGQGIYQYTLISTKPVWEIGTVLKL